MDNQCGPKTREGKPNDDGEEEVDGERSGKRKQEVCICLCTIVGAAKTNAPAKQLLFTCDGYAVTPASLAKAPVIKVGLVGQNRELKYKYSVTGTAYTLVLLLV